LRLLDTRGNCHSLWFVPEEPYCEWFPQLPSNRGPRARNWGSLVARPDGRSEPGLIILGLGACSSELLGSLVLAVWVALQP